ncbi:uncharacterized protein [Nicotiana sylvestris]|uniref:uncharacterized protein n=1 Tax=Nicotiana sylvestris TaxID=4096 RepID=UPI00388CC1C2
MAAGDGETMVDDVIATLLLVIIATSRLAEGVVLIDGIPVAGMVMRGQLCCTPTGNPPGIGVPGATVKMSCDGDRTTARETKTDENGSYQMVTTENEAPFTQNSTPCQMTIPMPAPNCTLLPDSGMLIAAMGMDPLNIVNTPLGNVVSAVAQNYRYIAG